MLGWHVWHWCCIFECNAGNFVVYYLDRHSTKQSTQKIRVGVVVFWTFRPYLSCQWKRSATVVVRWYGPSSWPSPMRNPWRPVVVPVGCCWEWWRILVWWWGWMLENHQECSDLCWMYPSFSRTTALRCCYVGGGVWFFDRLVWVVSPVVSVNWWTENFRRLDNDACCGKNAKCPLLQRPFFSVKKT